MYQLPRSMALSFFFSSSILPLHCFVPLSPFSGLLFVLHANGVVAITATWLRLVIGVEPCFWVALTYTTTFNRSDNCSRIDPSIAHRIRLVIKWWWITRGYPSISICIDETSAGISDTICIYANIYGIYRIFEIVLSQSIRKFLYLRYRESEIRKFDNNYIETCNRSGIVISEWKMRRMIKMFREVFFFLIYFARDTCICIKM